MGLKKDGSFVLDDKGSYTGQYDFPSYEKKKKKKLKKKKAKERK